jgi:hypothetical protein
MTDIISTKSGTLALLILPVMGERFSSYKYPPYLCLIRRNAVGRSKKIDFMGWWHLHMRA